MSRARESEPPEDAFVCAHCRQAVAPAESGTKHRNHCPRCLWSLHVDQDTGDRRSDCRSPMEPVAVWVRRDGEWALVHCCKGCGLMRANRIAGDDNEVPLLSLAMRPLAMPPFPLDRLRLEPVSTTCAPGGARKGDAPVAGGGGT